MPRALTPSPFLQMGLFLVVTAAALVVNLWGTFLLALLGCCALLGQGQLRAFLRWGLITSILSGSMFYLLNTHYFALALCGMVVTIAYKMLPALIFAVLLGLIPINRLRATMNRLKIPTQFQMLLFVGLRYFGILSEELHEIRQARLVHGLSFANWQLIWSPQLLFEYSLVPMLMRTTSLIDELSVAAFVEGLINPYPKFTEHLVRVSLSDALGLVEIIVAVGVIACNH